MNDIVKPDFVTDEHLEYLDKLRESGVTNMFFATEFIIEEFPELSNEDAGQVLMYWMRSFGERHPRGE
jgi:hypothetical protein